MSKSPKNSFSAFANLAQRILETRDANDKITMASEYFRDIESDEVLYLAAQFLVEGAFSEVSGKRASVGHRTLAKLASDFCEIDYEMVFRPCRVAVGSSSETIQKLMANLPEAQAKWTNGLLCLHDIAGIFEQLSITKKSEQKQQIILESWSDMTPLEMKYFLRILGGGSLGIGFEMQHVIAAIAEAFGNNSERIRYTQLITGSVGETAVLAKYSRLDDAKFKLFHPLSFMLASPLGSLALEKPVEYVAEEKFDGIRCQIHISSNCVKLYSRDLNEITSCFPEVLKFFKHKDLPPVVLDGEICVFKNNTILPMQLLQKRMGVKKPTAKLMGDFPVLFIAFDLLYIKDISLLNKPLTLRREKLEKLAQSYSIPLSSQMEISEPDDVETLFNRAVAHGNEGLVLKLKDSGYEYGRRGKCWLKVKKPNGSLDAVILYAHAKNGKRGSFFSDFTLGISVKNDERFEEEFIPIGKTNSGFTNEELTELNNRIKELTMERFGSTLLLKPEIMVELEFEGIQVNKRTKAKYNLHRPRFKTIRWDLTPLDADTLHDVERMYDEKLVQERESQGRNPSFVLWE